jgi:hypothetical protein
MRMETSTAKKFSFWKRTTPRRTATQQPLHNDHATCHTIADHGTGTMPLPFWSKQTMQQSANPTSI